MAGEYHIGRSWSGSRLEGDCPCPKEACGLIAQNKIDPRCPQHGLAACKTIRQTHRAEDCPGKR